MNPELENLINMALADGDVSEKERAIILRKAEALGEDKDEVEMILDGKLALLKKDQAKQSIPPLQQTTSQQSNKEGMLKKCPSCGAPTQSFNTKCTACGHEFKNIEAANSVQKLFEMLNELEGRRGSDESNPLKAIGASYSKLLSGKPIQGGDKHTSQKSELIKNFPIPNTKEDIIEFLTLAVPRAKKKGGFWGGFGAEVAEVQAHNALVPTWHSKCEQIIMKARFSMKDDKNTLEEIINYAKELGIK